MRGCYAETYSLQSLRRSERQTLSGWWCCWWNSLDFWANAKLPAGQYVGKVSPICCGGYNKAVKVEKESGTLPKLNLPDFTIAEPLIRTKLFPDQPVGLIFDELLEIKSAKCCWHSATKRGGNSLTWHKLHCLYLGNWGEKQWRHGAASSPLPLHLMKVSVKLLPKSSTWQQRVLLYPQCLIRLSTVLPSVCMYIWLHRKLQGKV